LRTIIAGLDPAISEPRFVERTRFIERMSLLDGRIKSGHDGQGDSEPALPLNFALLDEEPPRLT